MRSLNTSSAASRESNSWRHASCPSIADRYRPPPRASTNRSDSRLTKILAWYVELFAGLSAQRLQVGALCDGHWLIPAAPVNVRPIMPWRVGANPQNEFHESVFMRRGSSQSGRCAASTTLAGQRQLFLPVTGQQRSVAHRLAALGCRRRPIGGRRDQRRSAEGA
jgi:hypothetical protein